MNSEHTALQRFWCARDGQIRLGSDGFLVDPELGLEWGHSLNPDVRPVDLLAEVPGLILLGEPGIGKSTTMAAERQSIEARIAEAGQESIWLDLHEIGSDAQLNRRLFDSPRFSTWKQGDTILNLFLDSLDECRVQVAALPPLLLSEFEQCPVDRLRVRIACRTADWPPSLERGMCALWGDDAVQVFELAPLRRADVEQAAKERGVAPHAFLAAIRSAGAESLAIKPLTLKFLLGSYERRGMLPTSQVELYEEGCRLLCDESEGRRELRLPRRLDAGQRLAVARRIAALSVFGNRNAVSTQQRHADLHDDLGISELTGGTEAVNGDDFVVGEAEVEETLNTGLFSSRGEGRLGWAHRTYAEFLAARYVAEQNLSLPQIISLVVHPGEPPNKLVPQLHQTVAWLAGMRRDVFRAVLGHDPEVLLRGDVGSATDEDRAALVSALLEASDAGEWFDWDRGLHARYEKLRHPGLPDQMRPYITDPAKGPVVRRIAMEIAEACEARELLKDLVAVALDPEVPETTRVSAALAVARMGDEDSRGALRGLLNTPPAEDPDLQLRGCALKATWPGLLPTPEFLAALVPPRGNLVGSYRMFINDDPIRHVPTTDLPTALSWAARRAKSAALSREIEALVNAVVSRAWDDLDETGVAAGLGNVALTRARHGDAVFSGDDAHVLGDVDRRRRALVGAVGVAKSDNDVRDLTGSGLILPSDALWVIEQYQNRPHPEKERWASLFRMVVRHDDLAALDAAWVLSDADSLLKEILAPLFAPVPLDSEQAKRHRDHFRMLKDRERRRALNQAPVELAPPKRVEPHLDRFEDGDLSAWWQLNVDLMLDNDGMQRGNVFESDLTCLPGWLEASEATKCRLIAAAERYVREAIPQPDTWIDWVKEFAVPQPDWAGFRALRLLHARSPDFLLALPSEVWSRWAPVLIAYPEFNASEEDTWHQQLVARAYQNATKEVLDALDRRIDAENKHESPSTHRVLSLVSQCWDGRLAGAILGKAQQPSLVPIITGELLEALFEHGVDDARRVAFSLIPAPLPPAGPVHTLASVVAALLLERVGAAAWPTIWPLVQQDHAFAELVLSRLVWDDRHDGAKAARLADEHLADLYIWLVDNYPPEDDPMVNGVVGFRAVVGMWRDAVLRQLTLRGSPGACSAVERIVDAFPNRPWLKLTLLDARTLMRQHTWVPPRPDEIRALAASADRRWVQNADQLLDAVVESLARLEDKLQLGEPPAAIDLWNEGGKDGSSPKDEERLSEYLKRHLDADLRDRGIIFNREVTNRRGEETDIRVEALLRGADGEEADVLSVVVEAKGCWNDKLWTAMETQLAGRYLAEAQTTHGLYVVGWYNCEKWAPRDWRYKKAPKVEKGQAQERLDAQAASVSRAGKRVRAVVLDTSLHH